MQLARAGRRPRCLLPRLSPQPHRPGPLAGAEPFALAQAGDRQAPPVLYAAALEPAHRDPERKPGGLGLRFPGRPARPERPKVMTGHDNGLITIALAEADDAERERRRTAMGEPYRTLLGHFRHEVGHYYWDRLVRDEGRLDQCRAE